MLLVFERSARRRHVETYWKQDHGRKTIKMEEKIAFRNQTGTVCFNISLGYKVKKRPITKTIRLLQPASTSRLLYVVTSCRCFYQSSSQNAEGWKGRGKVAIYCMRSRCSKIHKDSGPPIRGPGAMGWGPSRQTGNLVKHCAFPRGQVSVSCAALSMLCFSQNPQIISGHFVHVHCAGLLTTLFASQVRLALLAAWLLASFLAPIGGSSRQAHESRGWSWDEHLALLILAPSIPLKAQKKLSFPIMGSISMISRNSVIVVLCRLHAVELPLLPWFFCLMDGSNMQYRLLWIWIYDIALGSPPIPWYPPVWCGRKYVYVCIWATICMYMYV